MKKLLLLGLLCFGFAIAVGLLSNTTSDPSLGRTISYIGGFIAGCVVTGLTYRRNWS